MSRAGTVVAAAIATALIAAPLAGCSKQTRNKLLGFFFDQPGISSEPRPPTSRVRRDLLREIEELKRKLAAAEEAAKEREKPKRVERPVEAAKSLEAATALLPKDGAGAIDWVQALSQGAIAPRPSADPSAPAQAVLDLDVEFASSGRVFSAVFSHAAHTAWLGCGSCHPAIFPLKRTAPTVVNMAAIREGRYCGACHGRVAFGLEDRCARCHQAIPMRAEWRAPEPRKPIERARTFDEAVKLLPSIDGAPDWTKALREGVIAPRPGIDPKAKDEDVMELDVVRSEAQPWKVVFPHAAHTAWLVCDSCHPALFEMQSGATKISMEKLGAGQLCGVCHGSVAFPVDACARCHPAMGG